MKIYVVISAWEGVFLGVFRTKKQAEVFCEELGNEPYPVKIEEYEI